MNIKRIIREEMDDFGWMHDIKPTLGQMWDEGLITKGDILVLEGYVANDSGDTTKYFDDFKIKIVTKLRSIRDSKFIPLTKEGSEWTGYNNNPLWFFPTDADLLVLDHIKADESLNESDDSLKWIQDVLAVRLSEYENWILVNDIDPRSKKEGHQIQNYLFNLGYSWSRYRSDIEFKDFCIYGVYHYANNSKTLYYHDGCREAEIKITNKDIESGEWKVYYWSQINPVVMKEESGELDWIKNELSNKGPLDGIRFRVPRSIASRSINVIEDKDGDSEWVSVFWQTDDKGDIRSERYSREMVERYLSDGWWKRLN